MNRSNTISLPGAHLLTALCFPSNLSTSRKGGERRQPQVSDKMQKGADVRPAPHEPYKMFQYSHLTITFLQDDEKVYTYLSTQHRLTLP